MPFPPPTIDARDARDDRDGTAPSGRRPGRADTALSAILDGMASWDPPDPGTGGRRPYDVFVSYAAEDRPLASGVARELESLGWTVWMDDRIAIGSEFEIDIERALDDARCVVVLWSQASVASTWVRAEASAADDQGKLVPIRTAADIALPLRFRQLSTATLAPGGLRHMPSLVAEIGRLTGRTPTGVDVATAAAGRVSGARRVTPGRWRVTIRFLGAQGRYVFDLRPDGTLSGSGKWWISRAEFAGHWSYDLSREVLQIDASGGISNGTESHRITIEAWIDDHSARCRFDGRRGVIERADRSS